MELSPTTTPSKSKAGSIAELGALVRQRRRALEVSQADVAMTAGVGVMFVSDLENGKETIEIGRVWRVLGALGLDVEIRPRPMPNSPKQDHR